MGGLFGARAYLRWSGGLTWCRTAWLKFDFAVAATGEIDLPVGLAEIEHVFGGAAGADGLDETETVEVPVAIAHLDVHLATGIVGGEQHGWLLAGAFPAVGGGIGANGATGVRNGKRAGVECGWCGWLCRSLGRSRTIMGVRITREISHWRAIRFVVFQIPLAGGIFPLRRFRRIPLVGRLG